MRIYYVGESEGPTVYAATALGVDAERWSSLAEHVLEWRWVMERDYRIPSGATLRGADLLAGAGNPFALGHLRPWPDPERGAEIMMNTLRILEHAAWLRGSMKLFNVCLGKRRRPPPAPGADRSLGGSRRPLRLRHGERRGTGVAA